MHFECPHFKIRLADSMDLLSCDAIFSNNNVQIMLVHHIEQTNLNKVEVDL